MSKTKTNGKRAPSKCLNPNCQKVFVAGHYGDRQKVCGGFTMIACRGCKGSKKRDGERCRKCAGKGDVKQTCTEWYRAYWSQTRKPPRGIPEAVFAKLERACREDHMRHAFLITARYSAARKGELLGLKWQDVLDSDGKIKQAIEVRGQWDDSRGFVPTKTRSSKLVLFPEEARKELASFLKRCKLDKTLSPDARIFRVYESAIWKWFKALQAKLGIQNQETGSNYRVHDLRHTRAVELARAGRLDLAQKALGHRSPATTQIYAERRPGEWLDEMDRALHKRRR